MFDVQVYYCATFEKFPSFWYDGKLLCDWADT